jgi:preprotein translocase subunit YajC
MNALYIAQAAAGQEGDPMSMLITFGLIGIIFYFLLIRPQRKQQKELKQRQDSLKAGDKVVSAGGIYGIVREVQQDTVKLEIAPNTIIKMAKTSIMTSVAKDGSAEPVKK